MMVRYFAPALTRLGVLMAHPAAFLVLACYVGAWLVLNPKSFDLAIGGDRRHVADDTVYPTGGASGHAGHSREARRAAASRGNSPK